MSAGEAIRMVTAETSFTSIVARRVHSFVFLAPFASSANPITRTCARPSCLRKFDVQAEPAKLVAENVERLTGVPASRVFSPLTIDS